MHRLCLTALISLWPVMAPADAARGNSSLKVMSLQDDTLVALRWQARPVVVLGPDGDVQDQIARLQTKAAELAEREVVILTDGSGADPLRQGTAFQVLLVGKDGGVKLRRETPVDAADIIDLIDTMPMRQREAARERDD
ncbi:MAG: DUF4174 domain-containing protein [Pseudomonadota bacterium]|nr:DUF4174 domain-containing protein [Pseudomonadota bacterium]